MTGPLLALLLWGGPVTVPAAAMDRLKVSAENRHLVVDDGNDTPFEWLADTVWEVAAALKRDEVDRLLDDRRAKGLNVLLLWAVGWRTSNAYDHEPFESKGGHWAASAPVTRAGPDDDYWDHLDYVLDAAERRGLYVGLLPVWGAANIRESRKPPVRLLTTTDEARSYGTWIAERLRHRSNIVWVMGGDFYGFPEVVRVLAGTIRKIDPDALMTYHPFVPHSSSEWYHDDPWLDFNMIQTGAVFSAGPELLATDYAKVPTKPTVQAEPLYEGRLKREIGNTRYRGDAYSSRFQAYQSLCFGSFGYTYGNAGNIPFGSNWQGHLHDPGAEDMAHVRTIMDVISADARRPDQSLIISARGDADNFTLKCAYRSKAGDRALVYSTDGGDVTVDLSRFKGARIEARWFDPREGAFADAGTHPAAGPTPFDPPGEPGRDNDWVLVLDGS